MINTTNRAGNSQLEMETRQGTLMTITSAICIFSFCVVLLTISSFILSGSLKKLKLHFHVSEGLLGMLVALSAATPEISSAVTALFIKQHDVGVGIILCIEALNVEKILSLQSESDFAKSLR